MTIPLTVTAQHIATGEKKLCHACPVALAMIDAGFTNVNAGDAVLLGTWGGVKHIGFTGDVASRFMYAFDAGNPVSPFSFDADFQPVEAA